MGFHAQVFPEQERRMSDEEEEVRVFVHETVPTVIDRQSGIIGRKLQKAHDTFDIENAKIMKRELEVGTIKRNRELHEKLSAIEQAREGGQLAARCDALLTGKAPALSARKLRRRSGRRRIALL